MEKDQEIAEKQAQEDLRPWQAGTGPDCTKDAMEGGPERDRQYHCGRTQGTEEKLPRHWWSQEAPLIQARHGGTLRDSSLSEVNRVAM